MLRSVNSKTSVKIDICSITDFQNMTEYINNDELFESDIFIRLMHRDPFTHRPIAAHITCIC